jgi:hypothetical protein
MSSRNATRPRGFDPLSSLFDVVDPAHVDELAPPEEGESERGEVGAGQIDFTDPLFKSPPELPAPPAADVPEPRNMPAAASVSDPAGLEPARKEEPAAGPQIDKAAIARAVAKAAAARAAAATKAAAPKPAPPKPAPAPEKPAPAPVKAPVVAKAEPAPAPAARSRLASLAASGAGRKMSALEAARAAAEAEQQAHQHKAEEQTAATAAAQEAASTLRTHAMAERVAILIPQWLPSVGELRVANAMITDQREVLKAVWRSHRARFLADGQLERAVGAAAVLHALQHTAPGNLVAAHVVTQASDYLVWLDLGGGSLVAAFSDARAYFSGAVAS